MLHEKSNLSNFDKSAGVSGSKAVPEILRNYLNAISIEGLKEPTVKERKSHIHKFYSYLSKRTGVPVLEIEQCLNTITFQDIQDFGVFLSQLVERRKISSMRRSSVLLTIERYFEYLNFKKIIASPFEIPLRIRDIVKENKDPNEIKGFLDYLVKNEYGRIDVYRKYILYFHSFLEENVNENTIRHLNQDHLTKFEAFLEDRIMKGEISTSYVYQILKCVRLFIKYMKINKRINFSYEIPKHLIDHGKRANEYVSKEDIISLLHAIKSLSLYVRNLAIFLLLVETGCRPIEICNLKMSDIDIRESTITFFSNKSGYRKLKIDPFVMKALKNYIHHRSKVLTTCDSLFLGKCERPLRTGSINTFFSNINKLAFGQVKYSPKSFRHTYATNALDAHNDLDMTSKAMGHKHWISTTYYLHRSQKRLLKNTLPYDPTSLLKGDVN